MAKILLLEDDASLNRGISLKLEKEGYEVLSAAGVSQAAELFRENEVSLIISDISMEDGNGLEFCRDIRKISDVHLIFLTALDQEVDMVNGYDAGADDYITKPFSLKPEEASLKATLVRAVNGIYIKVEEKNIEIEVKEFSDIRLVHDSRWTAEAISNVLDNALKYSPEGTRIRIRVEPMVSYVFIEVEDEGIGIEKSDYQNIFKRFYRGSRSEVEAREGAGVGLYLVRKIFEGQGGNVCVVPAHRKGTVMRMMLPKKYAHTSS